MLLLILLALEVSHNLRNGAFLDYGVHLDLDLHSFEVNLHDVNPLVEVLRQGRMESEQTLVSLLLNIDLVHLLEILNNELALPPELQDLMLLALHAACLLDPEHLLQKVRGEVIIVLNLFCCLLKVIRINTLQ